MHRLIHCCHQTPNSKHTKHSYFYLTALKIGYEYGRRYTARKKINLKWSKLSSSFQKTTTDNAATLCLSLYNIFSQHSEFFCTYEWTECTKQHSSNFPTHLVSKILKFFCFLDVKKRLNQNILTNWQSPSAQRAEHAHSSLGIPHAGSSWVTTALLCSCRQPEQEHPQSSTGSSARVQGQRQEQLWLQWPCSHPQLQHLLLSCPSSIHGFGDPTEVPSNCHLAHSADKVGQGWWKHTLNPHTPAHSEPVRLSIFKQHQFRQFLEEHASHGSVHCLLWSQI